MHPPAQAQIDPFLAGLFDLSAAGGPRGWNLEWKEIAAGTRRPRRAGAVSYTHLTLPTTPYV